MSTNNGTRKATTGSNKYLDMDLLRFTTAGNVDDGKSTLIGRLLYDSKSIFEDQMEAIEKTSRSSGEEEVNLALLTDGLKAEREQKITIDVAYRYFATPKRKFIIADTPGHIQYTRNMVTGASTAELAIILVDATKGVQTQSKRHAFLSTLLQIPHLVVAVNKMDLVGYSKVRFDEIVHDFRSFAKKLDVDNITYIPISALKGDNVVEKGEEMSWYQGSALLHHLETVKVNSSHNIVDFRFPVQYVIRPNQNFRGFSGRVASGRIKAGEEILALPSRMSSRVKEIVTKDGNLDEAMPGDSITLTLEDEIDVSRGDMIVRKNNVPIIQNEFEAYLCWMNEEAMVLDKAYLIMHTTQTAQVFIKELIYRMNVDTISRENADILKLNEIGKARLQTSHPLFFDPYQINQKTGSFIIIDPDTNVTVGAGMIRSASTGPAAAEEATAIHKTSPDVVWEEWNIPREEREKRNGHAAQVLWFTGISGAGKSTIARELERQLWDEGKQTMLIDGDQMRHGLSGDLGFTPSDRAENIRRAGETAKLFYEHGNIVICAFVSPNRKDRERVRSLFPESKFTEIFVKCDRETAINRDPKGLYKKAQSGKIKNLTGYDALHESPEENSTSRLIVLDTDKLEVPECVSLIREKLKF